jgi:hypothetical protein
VGLNERGEGDVAGGGAQPVDHQRGHRGQHQVDQPTQPEGPEEQPGIARAGAQPGRQQRAEECSDGDGGQHEPVSGTFGVQLPGGEHHQQRAGGTGGQGDQRLRDRQGPQQPVPAEQAECLPALGPAARGGGTS